LTSKYDEYPPIKQEEAKKHNKNAKKRKGRTMQQQDSSEDSILDSDIEDDGHIDTNTKLNKRDIKGKIKLQRI
jgi:hypothetical protein